MIKKIFIAALLCVLSVLPAKAQISGAGNVGCPGFTVTGTVANSGTSNNTVLATIAATSCPAILVQLDQTTPFTGGAITFNLSNDLGTNYVAVPVAQVVNQSTFANLTNPYTLVASTNQAFLVILNGATYFQVKLTTAITGAGAVTPYVTPVGIPPGFSLDASGNLKVNVNSAIAAGGNVIGGVTQSGNWTDRVVGNTGVVLDAAQAATAPANQLAVGGEFLTSPPTITNGQAQVLMMDNKGNLLVNINAQSLTNVSVNEAQINSVTPLMNNGVSGTGSQRMNLASDNSAIANWGHGATASAVPSGATYLAGNGSGNLTGIIVCDNSSPINMSTATTTQIIAISGTGGRTYVCSMNVVVSAADNVAIISGSGTNCASNQAGLAGGTTAASGWNFGANGGLTMGSGLGTILKTVTTNNEICLVTSATAQVSGSISWTQF